MNPNLPPALAKISDWGAMTGSEKKGADGDRYAKLAHVKGSHGAHFGVNTETDYDSVRAFEKIIEQFILDTTHIQIEGTYQGTDVIHYFNDTTKVFVCTLPNNELHAGFKLSLTQETSLKSKGVVK